MGRIVGESESQFEQATEGIHGLVCCEFVDLGEQQTQWGPREQGLFLFQAEERDSKGRRKELRLYFTLTLGTASMPSKLRKLLESWRGRKFTAEELKGFDLSTVEGKCCQGIVKQVENRNGQMASRITDLLKPAPGFAMKPEDFKPWVQRDHSKKDGSGSASNAGSSYTGPEDDIPF